jgi:hypothetical protein
MAGVVRGYQGVADLAFHIRNQGPLNTRPFSRYTRVARRITSASFRSFSTWTTRAPRANSSKSGTSAAGVRRLASWPPCYLYAFPQADDLIASEFRRPATPTLGRLLLPMCYPRHRACTGIARNPLKEMVGARGIEPLTPTMSR